MIFTPRNIIIGLILLVLAIAVPVTVRLAQQQQQLKSKAAVMNPAPTVPFPCNKPTQIAIGAPAGSCGSPNNVGCYFTAYAAFNQQISDDKNGSIPSDSSNYQPWCVSNCVTTPGEGYNIQCPDATSPPVAATGSIGFIPTGNAVRSGSGWQPITINYTSANAGAPKLFFNPNHCPDNMSLHDCQGQGGWALFANNLAASGSYTWQTTDPYLQGIQPGSIVSIGLSDSANNLLAYGNKAFPAATPTPPPTNPPALSGTIALTHSTISTTGIIEGIATANGPWKAQYCNTGTNCAVTGTGWTLLGSGNATTNGSFSHGPISTAAGIYTIALMDPNATFIADSVQLTISPLSGTIVVNPSTITNTGTDYITGSITANAPWIVQFCNAGIKSDNNCLLTGSNAGWTRLGGSTDNGNSNSGGTFRFGPISTAAGIYTIALMDPNATFIVARQDLIIQSSQGGGSPTLIVTRAGTGTGTVASTPAGISCGNTCSATYNLGTSVTLTPTPDAGSTFSGWSGNCPSGSVTIDSDKTCIATFNLAGTAPTVTCLSAPNPVTSGATVTWTAAPSGGTSPYTYVWSQDAAGLGTGISVSTVYTNTGSTGIQKTANVTVTDSATSPKTGSNSCTVTVNPAGVTCPANQTTQILYRINDSQAWASLDNAHIQAGKPVYIAGFHNSSTDTGNIPTDISLSATDQNGNSVTLVPTTANNKIYTFTPSTAGGYHITAKTTNCADVTASINVDLAQTTQCYKIAEESTVGQGRAVLDSFVNCNNLQGNSGVLSSSPVSYTFATATVGTKTVWVRFLKLAPGDSISSGPCPADGLKCRDFQATIDLTSDSSSGNCTYNTTYARFRANTSSNWSDSDPGTLKLGQPIIIAGFHDNDVVNGIASHVPTDVKLSVISPDLSTTTVLTGNNVTYPVPNTGEGTYQFKVETNNQTGIKCTASLPLAFHSGGVGGSSCTTNPTEVKVRTDNEQTWGDSLPASGAKVGIPFFIAGFHNNDFSTLPTDISLEVTDPNDFSKTTLQNLPNASYTPQHVGAYVVKAISNKGLSSECQAVINNLGIGPAAKSTVCYVLGQDRVTVDAVTKAAVDVLGGTNAYCKVKQATGEAFSYTGTPTVFPNFTLPIAHQTADTKTFFVKFIGLDGLDGSVTTVSDPIQSRSITYNPNPAISIADCTHASSGSGTNITITGTSFGVQGNGKVKIGSQDAIIDSWNIVPNTISAHVEQRLTGTNPVSVTLDDGRVASGQCVLNITTVVFSTTLQCRAPGQFGASNVDIKVYEAAPITTTTNTPDPILSQKISLDGNGNPVGFAPVFERPKPGVKKHYELIIKAPGTLAKRIDFDTGTGGTVNLNNGSPIILAQGDIAPINAPDGIINSLDKAVMNSQWNIFSDTTRVADLNLDSRVNSIDYSCMRANFNKSDETYTPLVVVSSPTAAPTAAPTSSPTAVPTSRPTATPTSAPTAAPTSSPTAAPTASPTSSPVGAAGQLRYSFDSGFPAGQTQQVAWNQTAGQATIDNVVLSCPTGQTSCTKSVYVQFNDGPSGAWEPDPPTLTASINLTQ